MIRKYGINLRPISAVFRPILTLNFYTSTPLHMYATYRVRITLDDYEAHDGMRHARSRLNRTDRASRFENSRRLLQAPGHFVLTIQCHNDGEFFRMNRVRSSRVLLLFIIEAP